MYELLLDLSGMYVKSAQLLASKGDFMPEPWVRRLAAMFDSMPPKPWPSTRRVRVSVFLMHANFFQVLEISGVKHLVFAWLDGRFY